LLRAIFPIRDINDGKNEQAPFSIPVDNITLISYFLMSTGISSILFKKNTIGKLAKISF